MDISVSSTDLLEVMVGESIYVLMFCLALMFGLGMRKPRKKRDINIFHDSSIIPKAEYHFLGFLIVLGGIFFGLQLIMIGAVIENSVLAQVYDWSAGAFFSFTPLVASAILITKKQSFKKYPLLSKFALICLISLVIIGILTGARGRIMWVAFLIAITGYLNSERKYLIISVVLLFIFLPLFSFLGGQKNLVAHSILTGGRPSDLLQIIFEERIDISIVTEQNVSFLDSFAERAQGPRNSVVLYNLYDKGAGADPSIYLGAILFPVPRFFWSEKPIPGSLDGKDENSAVHKVMDIGYNLSYMGPLLASAHAYWEGGWIAVFSYGFITGLLWSFIFAFCERLPKNIAIIIALSFAASLLIDGFLTAFYPLYSFILIFWKWVMPTLFLYGCIKLLGVNHAKPSSIVGNKNIDSDALRTI